MYFTPGKQAAKIRPSDDYKFGNKEKGIFGSPFASLKTFHGSTFWGLDVMHLIGHGTVIYRSSSPSSTNII